MGAVMCLVLIYIGSKSNSQELFICCTAVAVQYLKMTQKIPIPKITEVMIDWVGVSRPVSTLVVR